MRNQSYIDERKYLRQKTNIILSFRKNNYIVYHLEKKHNLFLSFTISLF
jgi:hypothetical protein